MKKRENSFHIFSWLFSFYVRHIGYRVSIVFLLSFVAAVGEGLGIAVIMPLLSVIEPALDSDSSEPITAILNPLLQSLGVENSLPGILSVLAALFLLKGALHFLGLAYHARLQEQLQVGLRKQLLRQYANMEYSVYVSRNTGHFVNLFLGQVDAVVIGFGSLKRFVVFAITVAVYAGIAFLVAPQFTVITLIVGGVLVLAFRGLSAYITRLSREYVQESSRLGARFVELMQSFKYLVATGAFFGLANSGNKTIERQAEALKKQSYATGFTEAIKEPISVFIVLGLLMVQSYILENSIAPMVVSLLLLYRAISQVISMQSTWQKTVTKLGAVEMVDTELSQLKDTSRLDGDKEVNELRDSLTFDRVSFSYGGDELALNGISVEIPARKTIALVGASGAGKSTFLDVLTLLHSPSEGTFYIDGVAGHDIRRSIWRKQIGYVPQDPIILEDTVANNISFLSGEDLCQTERLECVRKAAVAAYAEPFIQNLPKGYDTEIGDRGVTLSGGQRQRIAIARELFKSPSLLILDEATSALDSESEKYIKESLHILHGNLTIVIVAHRLSTVRNADLILVMERGSIAESGDFAQLQAQADSRFARMVALQDL